MGLIRWRATAQGRWLVLHLLAMTVAFGSKEAAIVLVAVVTFWCWWSRPTSPAADSAPKPPAWWIPVVPAWLLTATYLALRAACLGPKASAPLAFAPLRILVSAGIYLQGLWPFSLETGVHNIVLAQAEEPAMWVPAALAVVGWIAVAVWAVVSRRSGLMLLWLWLGASLVPVLLIRELNVPGVDGKYSLANRWMLPSAAAFSVALALLVHEWELRRPRVTMTLAATIAVWSAACLFVAPRVHATYASDGALRGMEERDYLATPERFRTVEDRCRAASRALIRAGEGDKPFNALSFLLPECANRADDLYNVFAALCRQGRFDDARRILTKVLANPPTDGRFAGPLHRLAGSVWLETGEPARAEKALLEAERLGLTDCSVIVDLGRIRFALSRFAEAARDLDAAISCQTRGGALVDPAVVLMGAKSWQMAGDKDAARRTLAGIARAQPVRQEQKGLLTLLRRELTALPLPTPPAPPAQSPETPR